MEGSMDRRATRTRRSLHQALISLILRKGYDAITVQEIIDEADIGRATFYAHYRGKEDLLRGGFEALRAELHEGLPHQNRMVHSHLVSLCSSTPARMEKSTEPW